MDEKFVFFSFICGKWNVYFVRKKKEWHKDREKESARKLRENKSVLSAHKQVDY